MLHPAIAFHRADYPVVSCGAQIQGSLWVPGGCGYGLHDFVAIHHQHRNGDRVLPVVGITLPFVSYGGSSLLTLCVAIGLIENVSMRRYVFQPR